MSSKRLEKGVRAVAVALVAVVGLTAATPSVHVAAETRGGTLNCDVNRTKYSPCGDTGYGGKCLYTYVICYSVAGWRYQTCLKKPLSANGCEKDVARCFPRDDYMPISDCIATYLPPESTGAASTSAARVSQVQ